jgi:NADPH:quinone reductase-like Zn-dependent oxidoreductase
MKAAVIKKWGNADVFEMEEIPKPIVSGNKLLIKVKASSINPVDWKHRKGNHRFLLGSPFPIVLGYDACGEVLETGPEVRNFKPGEIVFGDLDNKYGGALAEYALGSEKCFAHKPANLSCEEAAAIPLAGLTALQALRNKANIIKGQTVTINGASGGVGLFALQIAQLFGAKVIAISGPTSKKLVESFGVYKHIDYTKESVLTIGEKTDVFFDVAGTGSLWHYRKLLKPGGIYITSLPRPKVYLHGLLGMIMNKKAKTLLRKHSANDMELLAQWASEGKLKVTIDKIYRIDQLKEAHTYAETGHTKGKNIVVFP